MKTVTFTVVIPADRQLHLLVPEKIPPGPAQVVVSALEGAATKGLTAGDLRRSSLCGIWKDRTDMGESLEFARKLRAEAERRHRA